MSFGSAPPEDPADLVDRIGRGDSAAEGELAHQFRRRVFVMLLARLRHRDTAEELTQDTLIAVIAALRKGQLRQPSSLAAFVHGTARNLANNHLRARRTCRDEVEFTSDLQVAVPPVDFEGAQHTALVRREIAVLEPTDRQILWRTLVGGEKPGEIARSLGLSPEVVRTRKSRAVRRLADRLRSHGMVSRSPAANHSVSEAPG
jgi:RNA polymerase sigma-70 factor (ECF subfamily)